MLNRSVKTIALMIGVIAVQLAQGATAWKAGQHYFLLQPAQPTTLNSKKVEVTEVFSYGCPACNAFFPTAEKIRASLPATAQMTYVPAAFMPAENWPMYQRAYLTAQALGVGDKNHKAMFDAIWKTLELSYQDQNTQRPKKNMPTIEDAAKFYNRVAGIPVDKFVAMSRSFSVEAAVKRSDQLVKSYRVDSTPTMIVNGKYRITGESAGSADQLIELILWLVAQESK